MIYVMTVGAVALVILAAVGVTAAWCLARLMDRANTKAIAQKGGWGRVMEQIQSEPMSASVYYGARWVGICLLVGMLFSRVV